MGRVKKRSWDPSEVQIVTTVFSKHLLHKTLPSTPECYAAIKENISLSGRSVAQLKSWISNQYKKENRPRKITTRGESVVHYFV